LVIFNRIQEMIIRIAAIRMGELIGPICPEPKNLKTLGNPKTGEDLVKIKAMPLPMDMKPRVITRGLKFKPEIRRPQQAPIRIPTGRPKAREPQTGIPAFMAKAIIIPLKAMVEPIDKSIPPDEMTKTMPKARIISTLDWSNML